MMFVGSAVSAIWAVYSAMNCFSNECCDDRWISTNVTDLAHTIRSKVHGQHLVTETLLKHLQGHLQGSQRKALALSFHGGTGTGKNYDNLRDKIERAVAECPRALIIIDELDKMPRGLIDVIKPYLDFHDKVDGVDYRKAIFLLRGNEGANAINAKMIDNWHKGISRESIQLKDMENLIQMSSLNDKSSGLWHSELIIDGLITASLQFLPLERKHIKQCIKSSLIENKYFANVQEIPEEKVQEIADQLQYFPEDSEIFSTTGCKRVHDKVNLVMPVVSTIVFF